MKDLLADYSDDPKFDQLLKEIDDLKAQEAALIDGAKKSQILDASELFLYGGYSNFKTALIRVLET